MRRMINKDFGVLFHTPGVARMLFRGFSDVFEKHWYAIVVSTLYPTLFALSKNWYALSPAKVFGLLLAMTAIALTLALAFELVKRLICRVETESLRLGLQATTLAFLCACVLGVLLDSTFTALLKSPSIVTAFVMLLGLMLSFLFIRGGQKYYSSILSVLAIFSGLGIAEGVVRNTGGASQAVALTEVQNFESARFKNKPNIYFFIYDAYGSRDVYLKNLGFDNEAHYQALETRDFKVFHGLSNYSSTWPTTLGVFIGNHHYYDLVFGKLDTKVGRKVMAGLLRNPVFETLRENGYRIQQVHGLNYFVSERGKLDFLFPEDGLFGPLRIFDSRWFVLGKHSLIEQAAVFASRIQEPPNSSNGPWFTFSHVNAPGHSNIDSDWKTLAPFYKTFRERTKVSSAHMLETIDKIRAKDPKAVVIIIGDHGAWRYRNVYRADATPSKAFLGAGITAQSATLDFFGAMTAVGSNGLCDSYMYPGITPVNILRATFACLAEDRSLIENRPEDISLFRFRDKLYLTAKDGKVLDDWTEYTRPSATVKPPPSP